MDVTNRVTTGWPTTVRSASSASVVYVSDFTSFGARSGYIITGAAPTALSQRVAVPVVVVVSTAYSSKASPPSVSAVAAVRRPSFTDSTLPEGPDAKRKTRSVVGGGHASAVSHRHSPGSIITA